MRIKVGNQEIQLQRNNVKAAKEIVGRFMALVKKEGEDHGAPTFYFTVLLMMHYMSKDQLDAITPETLHLLLKENKPKK